MPCLSIIWLMCVVFFNNYNFVCITWATRLVVIPTLLAVRLNLRWLLIPPPAGCSSHPQPLLSPPLAFRRRGRPPPQASAGCSPPP